MTLRKVVCWFYFEFTRVLFDTMGYLSCYGLNSSRPGASTSVNTADANLENDDPDTSA